jgi:C4-dicarboxylate-specific signal transduction histidine kinase
MIHFGTRHRLHCYLRQFSSGETGFSKPLGSVSQPLIFETSLAIGLSDILPLEKVLSVIALITTLFWLSSLGLKQRARTKDAESRAKLSAQETRLAHASRVNAMGEMASGMAHELAQPLTAILSQAQAGRHLARRGDVERLGTVLDDTVSQAQRANILDRLRRWSKPNRTPSKSCAVHNAAQSVQNLLASEAKTKGAIITLSLHDDPLFIDADPVELEQVVFNLVRNALDASDMARVTISTHVDGPSVILDVSDSGPGVPEHLKPRIFEPFVTDKPDGTGLGLALCQRLVEEMGGDIALLDDTAQTTFRLSLPLSNNVVAP